MVLEFNQVFLYTFEGYDVYHVDTDAEYNDTFLYAAVFMSQDITPRINVFNNFFNLDQDTQNAILFHEVGHIVLGHIAYDLQQYIDRYEEIEEEADSFAEQMMSGALSLLNNI